MTAIKVHTGTHPALDEVMHQVIRLSRKGVENPYVRNKAIEITRYIKPDETGNPGRRDNTAIAYAMWEWMRENIAYVRDPFHVERLSDPMVILREGSGDCDDHVILAGSMLMSIGVPVRFVTIALNPAEPDVHTHIILQYLDQSGQWQPFDSTEPQKPGTWPPGAEGKPHTIWHIDGKKHDIGMAGCCNGHLAGIADTNELHHHKDEQADGNLGIFNAAFGIADIFAGGPQKRAREAQRMQEMTAQMAQIEQLRLQRQREMTQNVITYGGIAVGITAFGYFIYNMAK